MKLHVRHVNGGSCLVITLSEELIYEHTKDLPNDTAPDVVADAIMAGFLDSAIEHEPGPRCPRQGIAIEDESGDFFPAAREREEGRG